MYRKPHQHRGRYFNLHGESLKTRFKELLKTIFLLAKHFIIRPERHDKKAAHAAWHTTPAFVERSLQPHVTWLGHASFLIQVDNKNILTDPVFNEIARVTPRYVDSIVAPHHLPQIDAVVISHNHRDHLDETTVLALKDRVGHWFVPVGDKAWLVKRGITRVTEMTWWEKATVGDIVLHFLPAHHWSGRHIIDMNESLWGSWMIQAPQKTIYFAGDTAYGEHFTLIGKAFSVIEMALMPIGPNEPYTMRETHVSAHEAVQGFLDLGAQCFVPMHWGTFKLGADTFDMPIDQLRVAWDVYAKQLIQKELIVLKHGESIVQDDLTLRRPLDFVSSEKSREIT